MRRCRFPLLAIFALASACSSSSDAPPRPFLVGKVVLAGEADASGVVVTLGGPDNRTAVTDASGSYAFRELAGGEYALVASARSTLEGIVARAVTVSENAEVVAPELAFTPVGEIAGRVTLGGSDSGNAGVAVVVTGAAASAVTDDSGAFVVRGVPSGSREVIASRAGYAGVATAGLAVPYGGRVTMESLALAPARATGAIAGAVAVAGSPGAAGVTVTLAGPASGGAITDASGAYRFDGLPDGAYTLVLAAPSTAEGTRTIQAAVSAGAETAAPAASFTALGRLAGRATLAAGEGHAGTVVRVLGTDAVGVTDAEGAYAIAAVAAGARAVAAQRPGYLTASAPAVTVAWDAEAAVADLVLERAVAPGGVAGKVVVAGAPSSAGVTVTLAGPVTGAAVTGAGGAYAFADLPDGTYTVTALAPSTAEGTATVTASVAGAVATAPDLAFSGLGSLSGRVTLAGAPTGNGGIVVALAGGSIAGVTDDAGDFRLERVPVGTHEVLASRAGYRTGSAPGQAVAYAATTAVPTLDLAAGGAETGALAGTATLVGMDAHGGTTVTIAGTGKTATTAADGSWTIGGVADGLYTLSLENGEYAETIPGVLSLSGGTGFVVEGSLHALGGIELARARRLFSGDFASSGKVVVKEKELLSKGATWTATPDRSRIVALVAGALVSAPVAGGDLVTLARDVLSFQVSPTGTAVLYRTYAGSLEAVSPAGGAPRLLGVSTSDPSFTADGTKALFTKSTPEGSLVHLAEYDTGAVFALGVGSWSIAGGGAYLLIRDYAADTLSSASVATGAVVTLGTNVQSHALTPAGTAALVLSDYTGSAGRLSLVPLDGGGTVLAADARWDWTWSDDGTKLAFARFTGGSYGVQVSAVPEGTTLISEPSATGLGFSPGSQHYVYRSGASLYALPAGGGTPVALSHSYHSGPEFSPSGEHVLFTEYAYDAGWRYTAKVASLAAGEVRSSYSAPPGYYVSNLRFSPDSTRAYAYHPNASGYGTWAALPTAGGAAATLSDATSSTLQFTPDGAFGVFPAYVSGAWTLHSVSVATGAVVDLGAPWASFSFSPGSTRVLYSSGGVLGSVPVAGGSPEVLGTDVASWQVSPDGSTLALVTSYAAGRTLATAPAEGGAATPIDAGVASFEFTGDRVVYATTAGALRVAPLGGPPVEVAALAPSYFVTPDRSRVVYVDDERRLGTAPVATGVASLLATVDVAAGAFATLSPAGDRVAFVRDGVVSTVPLAGGPVTPHVRSGTGTFSWLDDGHLVVGRTNATAPYTFQNGLYVSTVP